MKGTDNFTKAIEIYLEKIAMQDPKFKEKFENSKKNIKDCITYILNTVKKSGSNGFEDNEIYGMALHYYDEENIDVGKPITAQVVVNHQVKLTPDEIEKAKKDAIAKVHEETRQKMIDKKSIKKVKKEEDKNQSSEELTLF